MREDDGRPRTDAEDKPKQAGRGARRRRDEFHIPRSPLNQLRAALGMRVLPHVPKGVVAPAPVVDDDPGALQRVRPYILATLAFAAGALLLIWAYGLLAIRPTEMQSESAAHLAQEALSRLQAGDTAGAQKTRDDMRRQDPREPALHLLDGYFLAAELDDDPDAVAKLSRRAWTRGRRVQRLVTLAGYREATGDPDGALEAMTEAADLEPGNYAIGLLRAIMLLTLGRHEEALAAAEDLNDRIGAGPGTLEIRGRAFLSLGRPGLARREFEAALMYDQGATSLRLGLAESLTEMGEFDSAGRELRAVIAQEPDNAAGHFSMGLLHERAGNPAVAVKAYQAALALAPRDVKSLNNLAYVLAVRLGKPAEALKYAEPAYKLAPRTPAVMDTLGWAYHLLGRHEEAVALLREGHEGEPDTPELQLHLGLALVAQGNGAEGRDMLQAVADSADKTPSRAQARKELRELNGKAGAGADF